MSLHRELNRRFAAERGQLSYDMGRKLRYRMGLLLSQDPASRMVREWIYQAFEGEPRPAPAPACPVCGVGAGQHAADCAMAAREGSGRDAGAGAGDRSSTVPGAAQNGSGAAGGA